MRIQRTEKKHGKAAARLTFAFAFLCAVSLFANRTPAGVTAYAAERLATPDPYKESEFGVGWERVSHAAGYEVRLKLQNTDDNKTVTRLYSTTLNHLDLTLYAAGCVVTTEVRAVPSANTRSKYSNSDWGACDDTVEPSESNSVSGYADVSGGKFILTDENGARYSGWQKVNNSWFYLDPADSSRTATGWLSVSGATYYFETSGRMHTGWLEWEKNWYYLNPANSAEGKMVSGWVEVSPGKPYYFTENATAGYPRGSLNEAVTNASYPNSNPPYPINRDSGSSSGGNPPQETPAAVPQTGWRENPNGTWSYYENGALARSTWKNIDGFWYYFDGSGLMQSGWQRIGGAWYYLEPNKNGSNGYKHGAAWMNATTPDGYTVNGSGQWTVNGVVVTSDGSSSSGNNSGSSGSGSGTAGELKQIKNVTVSVNSTDARGGRCRYAEVSGATDCVIVSKTCSDAYENWTPGMTVTFTVELEPKSGYTFTTATHFRANGGELVSAGGDSLRRTVRISYTASAKLDAPEVFYITDANELKWMPVPYAKRYKVTVTGGDAGGSTTKTVNTNSVDLWDFGDIDRLDMKATVSALGSEDARYTLESEKVTVSDLGSYKKTHNLNGTFEYREGTMRFRDDGGTTLTGWQQLAGNWFYFKKGGAAAGPGWFRDETGYWYYFDSHYRMVTGNVNVNGTVYFLNDGSRGNLPLGAWVQ